MEAPPKNNIFNEIWGYAESMKQEVDTTKTLAEINMIKKMEMQ